MVFSTVSFVFGFLPVVLILYKLAGRFAPRAKRVRWQNALLLAASLVFYAWGGVRYLALLVVLIAINWLCGLRMAAGRRPGMALAIGLVADLGVLAVCKYFNFVVQNLEVLAKSLGAPQDFTFGLPVIPLPIGISFFTFQIMSYLIDLYRGKVQVQKSPAKLALYVMMFPQLIAGPIVRYADIEREIDERATTPEEEDRGLRRFVMGFAKKVLLANTLAAFADLTFARASQLHPLWAWLGAVCYALHIYMDFSAYSDMAIGLGWIFGFHFNENFNYPYIACSVKEFWRRWHISLSGWFRDYVYIPLGGSRCGAAKTYRNLLIVFFLTGLWHGAAWQFVFWGLFHGFFLVMERLGLGKLLEKLPRALQHAYTLLVVLVGWVFFRADNMAAGVQYLKSMLGLTDGALWDLSILPDLTGELAVFGLAAVVISMPVFPAVRKRCKSETLANLLCLALFFVSLCFMTGAGYNPFIYFRF